MGAGDSSGACFFGLQGWQRSRKADFSRPPVFGYEELYL